MALIQAESVEGFQRLPVLRQVGLMMGLAASVALGVSVILWAQTPPYTLLYGNLSGKDASDVLESLQKSGIDYKIESGSGAILVPNSSLHQARMELARDGLPEGNSMGFEILEKEQGFGTSQFIEKARYQRAMEGEIANTITSMKNVEYTRVHLAIPKRSVFLRDKSHPTASVMIKLRSGRVLSEEQVAAVMHLVSSSVPYLEPENITVVDQSGNLLNNGFDKNSMGNTSSQFSYNRKLEDTYSKRIRTLLEPMVGAGKVRASISAELDFTETEKTEESYNPDLPALRSEQLSENQTQDGNGQGGIPGALTNQPPEDGQLQQGNQNGKPGQTGSEKNSSRRTVRNYELDKTISHTKLASGAIRRLSIAVVLDNKIIPDPEGASDSQPWSQEEISQFTALIKESVGFNEARGDSVNVINAAFIQPVVAADIPEESLMDKPWIWDVAKQLAGVLGLVLLIFGVLKPTLKSLAVQQVAVNPDGSIALSGGGTASAGENTKLENDQLSLSDQSKTGSADQPLLAGSGDDFNVSLEAVQNTVKEDPKRAAQLIKNWISEDE
ncbi:MAG: flagellar basal-body MS-ring/collar protein FliF [Gammaproteobacteria bacterium]